MPRDVQALRMNESVQNPESTDRARQARQIVNDVLRGRAAGEPTDPQQLIAAHRDLMPELAHELRKLELIERARRTALESDPPASRHGDCRGPPPDSFPGYEIVGQVHRGGQGVVFEAVQKSTKRKVAIKVLREGPFSSPHDQARFDREVRILASLKHPNIVAVHDSGVAAGSFYFVMDYVPGRALDAYLASGQRPLKDKLRLFEKIATAVHAAHLRGVIHRDLKPGNIRIDEEGEPRILDFGLAKVAAEDRTGSGLSHSLTVTGQFVGSLPWAAPEQVDGSPDHIDIRTDVYSLGVILFQALTRQFPYSVIGPVREVMEQISRTEPTRPGSLRPEIDEEVETIVLKCLAKERGRRYQSAGELARDIQHYLAGEPIEAKRDSSWYMFKKAAYRYRLPIGVGVTIFLLLVAFGVGLSVMYRREQQKAEENQRLAAHLLNMFEFGTTGARPEYPTLRELLDRDAAAVAKELESRPQELAEFSERVAGIYLMVGAPDKALPWAQRLVELHKDRLKSDPLSIASKMVVLANALAASGRNQEARECFEIAVTQARQESGGPHAELADLLDSYGSFIGYRLGDLEAGRRFRDEALEIIHALYPEDHIVLAGALSRMGGYLHDMAEFDVAESYYTDALAIYERLGAQDSVWDMKLWLGLLYKDDGRFAEAEPYVLEALHYFRARYGEKSLPVAQAYLSAAKLFTDAGDLSRAEHDCRAALGRYTELFGPDHERTAEAMTQLGQILVGQSRYAEAEPTLRRSLAIRESCLPEGNWERAKTATLLGAALAGLDRFDEAEPFLEKNVPIVCWNRGTRHRRCGEAIERVIFLYDRWGKPDQAEEWRARWSEGAAAPPVGSREAPHGPG